jgi:hypothetical protein
MKATKMRVCSLSVMLAAASLVGLRAGDHDVEVTRKDFGLRVQRQLWAHSEQLFGVTKPLPESALGHFHGSGQFGRRDGRGRADGYGGL